MRMAVRHLFRAGGAYFDDFDIEGQGFTGHRMVGVDIGKLVADLGDEHMARALLGFQLGDHARLPVVRLAATGVFNDFALFITDTLVKQDHLILFDWHRILCKSSKYAIITSSGADSFRDGSNCDEID